MFEQVAGWGRPRVGMGDAGMPPGRTDVGVAATSKAAFWIEEDHPNTTIVVLALHGDADLNNASELNDRLGEAIDRDPSAVVVDLSAATFLDSTTLGILLRGMKRLREKGGSFRMVEPRAEIRRIFELTLLDRVFELDASRQAALSASGFGKPRVAGISGI
jgi:anti-sigma B factor antagonist